MPSKRQFAVLGMLWTGVAIIVYAFAAAGIRLTLLSRDPSQVQEYPVYIGFLSNLGALAWCSAAAVCFFASWLLRVRKAPGEGGAFMLYMGVLSTALLVDDFFLLHEVVAPKYLHFPRDALLFLYVLLGAGLLIRHGKFILQSTPYVFLFIGFGLLGVSMAMDLAILPGGTDVEDGAKILGIVAYAYYCVITSAGLAAGQEVETGPHGKGTS